MNFLFKFALIINTLENFPTAFLDKLGFLKGNVIYKIRGKNLRFLARARTEDMPEVVVASGYEYNTRPIKLPQGPLIVDLGGHIGTFSIYMARELNNKCKIYTYEPDKENYSMLLQNIKINKVNSVYPRNIAILDYVGEGYLEKENMNTDAYYLNSAKRKLVNCKVTTLPKEFKSKKIDLLKMDIEGGEYKVLLNKESFNFIKNNIHYIFMEFHNISKRYNYSVIKKIVEENFRIIGKQRNVITLENLNWDKRI